MERGVGPFFCRHEAFEQLSFMHHEWWPECTKPPLHPVVMGAAPCLAGTTPSEQLPALGALKAELFAAVDEFRPSSAAATAHLPPGSLPMASGNFHLVPLSAFSNSPLNLTGMPSV